MRILYIKIPTVRNLMFKLIVLDYPEAIKTSMCPANPSWPERRRLHAEED